MLSLRSCIHSCLFCSHPQQSLLSEIQTYVYVLSETDKAFLMVTQNKHTCRLYLSLVITVRNSSCGTVMFFISVCHSVHAGVGVCVAEGVCMAGGGVCGRGYAWRGRGVCDRRDGHCSGRYASYRNAFLFQFCSLFDQWNFLVSLCKLKFS